MSADAIRFARRGAWAATALALALSSQARGLDLSSDLPPPPVSNPFADPLRARPPVLDTRAILPGDGAAAACPAEADMAAPLALSAAVDLALCNNAQLKAAWAAIKIQAGAVGEARAAYLPTLTASASRQNDRTTYPDGELDATTVNSGTASATLSWRLFDFGQRRANRLAADHLLAAALANHDAALQKTLATVIGAYFDAQTARAAWLAKQQNVQLAQRTFATAQRREASGAGARSDTLQTATALARATLEQSRAGGAYRKTMSVLVYALGVPADTNLTLADDLADGVAASDKDLRAWLELAQRLHPAIAAARAKLAAAEQKTIATQSEGLPTLDFSGNYYRNGRPNQGLTPTHTQERTLGVTLTVPIFEGFARTYKVRGALAQAEQRLAELQDTEQQILMEVVKAHADATAALANLAASESLLSSAQEALTTVQRKFDRGAADVLEILGTQTALSDARQERIRCLAEWRSARLTLLANAGQLGRQAAGP